ncbi:hypothetical protein LTR22_026728 [Elasticomyces elasticus]|nr:hypothetical protein LTR22_026728 [Elasticomyces elasticus]
MALATQLSKVLDNFQLNAPAQVKHDINKSRLEVTASFRQDAAIQEGAVLPAFELVDANGVKTSSADLLSKGPILVAFYRGGWCPFCNLALRDLQSNLETFTAKGINLVAISPELPDRSLSTLEKNELGFSVLSDIGNVFARKLGIVWKQPDSLRPHVKAFGNDLQAINGDDSFEVPVPCTLLVDQRGIVRNLYIEADYTKRLDGSIPLAWADEL